MGQGMWIPSSSKPLIFWELGYLAAFYSVSVSSTPTTTTKKCLEISILSWQFPKGRTLSRIFFSAQNGRPCLGLGFFGSHEAPSSPFGYQGDVLTSNLEVSWHLGVCPVLGFGELVSYSCSAGHCV